MDMQLNRKTIPLRNISISIEEVKRIVQRLLPHVEEEKQRAIDGVLQSSLDGEVDEEELRYRCEEVFRITVVITGTDGEILSGYGAELFDSPNIPESILTININNNQAFETNLGRKHLNNFVLHLDFSSPPLVDTYNFVSNQTPNYSSLVVEGERQSWVASIEKAVMDVLKNRSNNRSFLHRAFVYDFGLVFFVLPVALLLCWRLSGFVETKFGSISLFLSTAAYIYIVILVLCVYRVLFGLLKLVFPTVELTNKNSQTEKHRKILYSILGSIPVVWGLLSWIFG